MLSLLHIQIIIEVAFFGAILCLLWRLKRDLGKHRLLADGSGMDHLKQSMVDSQAFVNAFMMQMEESKHALSSLAHQLDEKEKSLTILLGQAETVITTMNSARDDSRPDLSDRRYDNVIELVRQGVPQEEISKQSGLAEDEINLIRELLRARMGRLS